MSDKDKKNVQEVCAIYKELPDYLKGKIDGYAEAIKEKNVFNKQPSTPEGE